MINIIHPELNLSMEFYGLKVIQCDPQDKLILKLLDETSQISIDNKKINHSDIIYLTETSRTSEILVWNKQSRIYKEITDLLSEYPLINEVNKVEIINFLNNKYQYDFLSTIEGDITKLILNCFEVNNESFLTMDLLQHILEADLLEGKKFFIFNNFPDLSLDILKPYLNQHHFLVLTNDFRNVVKQLPDLQCMAIYKKNHIFEIFDVNTLVNYLDLKLGINLNYSSYKQLVDHPDDFNSLRMLYIIKNIEPN